MKLWNIISGHERRLRVNEEFERLCQMMMDAPSFRWSVGATLDNEFYSHFGMSADEVAGKLLGLENEGYIQKHGSTY